MYELLTGKPQPLNLNQPLSFLVRPGKGDPTCSPELNSEHTQFHLISASSYVGLRRNRPTPSFTKRRHKLCQEDVVFLCYMEEKKNRNWK